MRNILIALGIAKLLGVETKNTPKSSLTLDKSDFFIFIFLFIPIFIFALYSGLDFFSAFIVSLLLVPIAVFLFAILVRILMPLGIVLVLFFEILRFLLELFKPNQEKPKTLDEILSNNTKNP